MQRATGKISHANFFRRRLLTTFYKKESYFFPNSGGTNFAHLNFVNAAKTVAYLSVIFPLLLMYFLSLESVKPVIVFISKVLHSCSNLHSVESILESLLTCS